MLSKAFFTISVFFLDQSFLFSPTKRYLNGIKPIHEVNPFQSLLRRVNSGVGKISSHFIVV